MTYSSNNGFLLNLAEVVFSVDKIRIFAKSYEESDSVTLHRDYYCVRRGNLTYAWSINPKTLTPPKEYQSTVISIAANPDLFSIILETALARFFANYGYDVRKEKYSSTLSIALKNKPPHIFKGISLYPFLHLSTRSLITPESKECAIFISAQTLYKPKLTFTDQEYRTAMIDTRLWDRNRWGELVASKKNVTKLLNSTNQTVAVTSAKNLEDQDGTYYKNFVEFIEKLKAQKDKVFLPDSLKIQDLVVTNIPNKHFSPETIKKPIYYYYNERTLEGKPYNQAIAQVQPSSYDIFANKVCKIAVLTLEQYEGSTGSFIKKIENNLKNTFHLKVEINTHVITGDTQQYIETIKETDLINNDLVIVVVNEKDKTLPIEQSPYHHIKAKLIGMRIPTQDLTIEKVKNSNIYIENNVTLNIYAKLGGTAWTIEKDEKNKQELIIGIGATVSRTKDQIIGFANIFDHNGTYLVGNCSQLSTKTNYRENLAKHLIKSIQNQIEQKSIDKETPLRLIFHLFKDAGYKYEIAAINETMQEFTEYNIQYALVHLSYEHNYYIFCNSGNTPITRGTYVPIDTDQALLHLGQKSRTPILVRVDSRSTYKDIFAISKQILFFAHLSQRNYIPASTPVTISYPKLMAKLSDELKVVPNWDVNQLEMVQEKLWFI